MVWWKHMSSQVDIISKVFWFLLSGEIRGRRERTLQVPNLNFLTLKSDEFTLETISQPTSSGAVEQQ